MRQKSLVWLSVCVILCLTIGCLQTIKPSFTETKKTDIYSYQGPIDPNEFTDWEQVAAVPLQTPYGFVLDIFIKNPDSSGLIQYANAMVIMGSGIAAYFIVYHGEFYQYNYNSETNCFECQKEINPDTLEIIKKDFKEHFGLQSN